MLEGDLIPLEAHSFEHLDLTRLLSYSLNNSTIAMYQRDCRAYSDYAYTEGLDWLKPSTLVEWRDTLNSAGKMSPHTINRMLSSVRRIVKELAKRNIIDEDISIRFDRVDGVEVKRNKHKLKTNARTPITPDEMRAICNAPDISTHVGRRDKALLMTLATSGLRASEAATLTLDQVKARDGGYVLLVRGKTDIAFREAHLSKEAYEAVKEWLTTREVTSHYIFTSFETRAALPKDTHISEATVWNIVTRYAKACGYPDVKPHDFRRFLGTRLAKQDIRKAQKALGHKNIETTARHYVLDELEVGLTDNLF